MEEIKSLSRVFFGIGLIGIGAEHLIFRSFIPVMVPMWPQWVPGYAMWVYLVGLILIVGGALIVVRFKAREVSSVVGVLFLASFILLHIPANIAAGKTSLGAWTNAFKEFSFCGCAFVVAAAMPGRPMSAHSRHSLCHRVQVRALRFGKYPLAIMVFLFGIDHFLYTEFVATLVPSWIPGHVFWTYFAGGALIAAGAGIMLNIQARLAATMLGIMLIIWLIILHFPRAFADPTGNIGNEWTSVWEVFSFSGAAFIMGQTLQPTKRTNRM